MDRIRLRRVAMTFVVVLVIVGGLFGWLQHSRTTILESQAAAAQGGSGSKAPAAAASSRLVKVDVVKPTIGGMDRTCVLPGFVHAYESAELFAKVSGYLLKLEVDIGDRVKEGQLLAELYSPELHRDVDRGKASVDRAEAQVGQMRAHIASAKAQLSVAIAGIARADAGVKRDKATYAFRNKQFVRFQELVNADSVDQRLVDEKKEQQLAAEAAIDASEASLEESKAQVVSANAKVTQAEADLTDAEAEVEVAKANLAKAQVLASYTQVISPYDGVITLRTFHRGAFIRGADQTGVHPLLTVERTDIVRLVVFIPDSDVPFTDPGDDTETSIDALPGHKFSGKVSRIAFSEDFKNKTMRTEIDLPNKQGLLRVGMYGKTKLILQAGNPRALTVPSTAVVGSTKNGKGTVFVSKEGKAHKVSVAISADNGVLAEITEGVTSNDLVIVGNNNSITDGQPIEPHEMAAADQTKK